MAARIAPLDALLAKHVGRFSVQHVWSDLNRPRLSTSTEQDAPAPVASRETPESATPAVESGATASKSDQKETGSDLAHRAVSAGTGRGGPECPPAGLERRPRRMAATASQQISAGQQATASMACISASCFVRSTKSSKLQPGVQLATPRGLLAPPVEIIVETAMRYARNILAWIVRFFGAAPVFGSGGRGVI